MMPIWQMPISLALVNERCNDTMSSHLAIEFIDFGDNFLVARMPITQKNRQPLGIMHGGASCVLAETVGSAAANFCVDQTHYYCVGLDINTNHIRSIKEGLVFAKAMPFHLGKSTQVWSIEITNEEQKFISINRLTMAVLKREH
jgi:1,4-dihydroxy-2-naphthoyl-CoA hydrolase